MSPFEDGPWLDARTSAQAPALLAPTVGDIIEVTTVSPQWEVDGSALVVVKASYPADAAGVFASCAFGGASSPTRQAELDGVFQRDVAGHPLYVHFCAGHRGHCQASVPNAATVHFDAYRKRRGFKPWESWVRHSVLQPAAPPGLLPPSSGNPAASPTEVELRKKIQHLREELQKKTPGGRLFDAVDRRRKKVRGTDVLEDEAEDDSSLFGKPPSPSGGPAGRIQALAAEQPGALMESGLTEISKLLGEREGGATSTPASEGAIPARVLAYLTSVFHGRHPPSEVGLRTSKEMRTLARALDALAAGQLPQVGDLLMQRFKALETSVADKSWAVASGIEVVDETEGLATREERAEAAKTIMLKQKLEEAKQKLATGAAR